MIAKRAWLYCRVENGWDWDSYEFMELQKALLEKFCAEHGMEVVATSTVTGGGQDELWALVTEDMGENDFDILLATSSTRFSNNLKVLLGVTEELAAAGKAICMVQDKISFTKISNFTYIAPGGNL